MGTCGTPSHAVMPPPDPMVFTHPQRVRTPLISAHQFCAVKGRSTAQAHERLLQQISEHRKDGLPVLFDLYLAFHPPPQIVSHSCSELAWCARGTAAPTHLGYA